MNAGSTRKGVESNAMDAWPQYRKALDLERDLGDPTDPDSAISFAATVEDDEREAFPDRGVRALASWGLQRHLVPAAVGGALEQFDELSMLMRLVARRDLTVAVAIGQTFLGTVSVWVAGNDAQKRRAADVLLNGGVAALALTEQEHGSDLAASEVSATPCDGGFLLDGTKWLINNATRSRLLGVLARTHPGGGLRGFSLLLVDKEQLARDSYECLPKIRTHGIRGADISGIRFSGARIGDESVIKRQGRGLDVVLRSLNISRALVSTFSLGALDTGLRTTLDFACKRRLYGSSMLELPTVRHALVGALIDLITCESISIAAARSLHSTPEQASVNSAVAKYFVPSMTEEALRSLSVVLGARYYLRDEHVHGIFQKVLRDNAVLGLFDGSTAVNLSLLASQLPSLCRSSGEAGTRSETLARNRQMFCLTETLPTFEPERLALDRGGQSDVLDPLRAGTVERLREIEGSSADGILAVLSETLAWLDEFRERVLHHADELGSDFPRSQRAFDLAREYCALHASASCMWIWLHNRENFSGIVRRGDVTLLAMQRLLQRHGRTAAVHTRDAHIHDWLHDMHRTAHLFSCLRIPLGTTRR